MTIVERSMDKIIDQMPLQWLPLPATQSTLSDVAQQIYKETSSFDQEWKDLRFEPWRFFYLDYHHLQQDINVVASFGNLSQRFESEWNKVYEFYILKKGEIERRIQSCQQNQKGSTTATNNEEELKAVFMDIHQLYHFAKLNYCGFLRLFMQYDWLFRSSYNPSPSDLLRRMLINKPFWDHSIVVFDLATRLNYLCIDQRHHQDLIALSNTPLVMNEINPSQQSFFSAVENLSTAIDFKQQRYMKPIHPLSTSISSSTTSTMGSCETALSHHTISMEDVQLPKHSKKTKKYWVHPDNILEIMLLLSSKKMILQNHENNPSSTYTAVDEVGHPQGIKSKLAAMSPQSIHLVKKVGNGECDKSGRVKVTTIYMDSPNFNDYTERVVGQPIVTNQHDDEKITPSSSSPYTKNKCVSTRVRWYDRINNKSDTQQQQQDDIVSYSSLEQKVYYKQQHDEHHYQYPFYNKGYKGHGKEPQQQQHHYFGQCDDKVGTSSAENHYWVQQRLWLKSKHVNSWMNNKYSISNQLSKPLCQYRADGSPTLKVYDKQRMENACSHMENEVHNKLKIPVIKTTQYRTVYTSSDNRVTISIDTDIAMMRPNGIFDTTCTTDEAIITESTAIHHRQLTESNQYPYYNVSSKDIVRFPYCVIQISSSDEEEDFTNNSQDMTWLSKLESSPMLEPAHDFSTFLHGVGTLLYDQVHVFPSWLSKMEILDIRHITHRGSLLFTEEKVLSETAGEKSTTNNVTHSNSSSSVISSRQSSSNGMNWSSNTIATIVTCYDEEEEDNMKDSEYNPSPSSSSSSSSLLSPVTKQQKLRRSFDSYCSFDHPTSSRSDPTNCKSCMGKMLNDDTKTYDMFRKKRDNNCHENGTCITFFSIVKKAIWRYNHVGARYEKEPLLGVARSNQQQDQESLLLNHNGLISGFSRATVLTTACVLISFSVSYLFYIFVMKI